MVIKCESQIEASWRALKAWKSGYKSYLNKEDVLIQLIRVYPYKYVCNRNFGIFHVFIIIKMWCFTLIKYFLTTVLMKFPLPN
uniref:Uncharacterized protein n=1 Tax=Helianthus annuus TaxID=4232 RepID=A0A251SBW5_HELAN